MSRANARSSNKAKKAIKKKADPARIKYLAAAAKKFIRESSRIIKKKTAHDNIKQPSNKIKSSNKKATVKNPFTRIKSKPSPKRQGRRHALESLGVVDSESRIDGDILRLDDDEPADVMLAFVDPANNNDKFYILQIIARVKGYVVHTRWGRTGAVGQSLDQDFDEVEEAIKYFKTKFREKTGLNWENRGNPTMYKKYRYIKQNFVDKRNGYKDSKWQYWVDDGVDGKPDDWYDYSATGSIQVEQLYHEHSLNGHLSNRLVQSGHFSYGVNLVQMTQTNEKHSKRTTRRIRRVVKNTSTGD